MISNLLAAASRCKAAIVVLPLCLVLVSAAPAEDAGRPKLLPNAEASDCAACHGIKSPLPQNHPATTDRTLIDCVGCHSPGHAADLRGRLPLSHIHLLRGLTCSACHADPKNPEPVPASSCATCHNSESVAAGTAAMKPTNPHDSPHYGKNSDCNLCHHQHEKSENYCAQCHKFDFKVP